MAITVINDTDIPRDSRVTINANFTDLDGRAVTLEADAGSLDGRATALEASATSLDGRATALEASSGSLDSRATVLEAGATELDSRATALEAFVTDLDERTDTDADLGVTSLHFTGKAGLLIYDEGSWAPSLSGAGTLPTFVTASGTYTRVGRLVFFNGYLNNTVGGTAGAGASQLSMNLPFATSAMQLPVRIEMGSSLNGTNEEVLFATLGPSSSVMLLWRQTIVSSEPELVALTPAHFNNAVRQIAVMGKLLA